MCFGLREILPIIIDLVRHFESISSILKINCDKLREILKNIGAIPPSKEPKTFISHKIFSKILPPIFPISSVWFHATRVINPESFNNEGINTTSTMRPRLLKILKKLSHGMEHSGDYPNGASSSIKRFIKDEGPSAFLFRSVAIEAPGFNNTYHKRPEIIEDIAGCLLGENYNELVNKYVAKSKPCIVSFRAKAEEYAFESALWYAYLIMSGCEDFEAAETANTCFDGKGVGVPPTDIIKIEILE
jgi:hypothetical protein